MQQVPEKIETIHLYVVREDELPPRPPLLPIALSTLLLVAVVGVCVLTPYQQPVIRATIRVPAVLLPPQTFTASAALIPTGLRTYPATPAHGIVTLTNGSVVAQVLPAGLIFVSRSGIEIITLQAVYVPAGSAMGYGVGTVKVKAVISGVSGNIPAYAVDAVYGTSLYIRNLRPFVGGKDAYSVPVVTAQDRQRSVDDARQRLTAAIIGKVLLKPCTETVTALIALYIHWICQFATYHVPSYMHVTSVQIQGKNLLVAVWFVAPLHSSRKG